MERLKSLNTIGNLLPMIIVFLIFLNSCKPTFNISEEKPRIVNALKNDLFNKNSIHERVEMFFPKEYWKTNSKHELIKSIDSIQELLRGPLHSEKKRITKHNISINKFSNLIKIRNTYFVLISINEAFDVIKTAHLEGADDIEKYIKRNLILYVDDPFKIIANTNSDILGQYDNVAKKWIYYNFNEGLFLKAYGMKDTKKIIDLYFAEIFEYSDEEWTKQEIKEIKDLYRESWDLEQYKYLNFDDYCNCKIEYQKKWTDDVPDEYFEQSEALLESIYRCRIYSTNLKKYETQKLP